MFEIIYNVAFQRAIVVGFFISISTAIVGNFVVASRQSMAPDMLAHTSLAGRRHWNFLANSTCFLYYTYRYY